MGAVKDRVAPLRGSGVFTACTRGLRPGLTSKSPFCGSVLVIGRGERSCQLKKADRCDEGNRGVLKWDSEVGVPMLAESAAGLKPGSNPLGRHLLRGAEAPHYPCRPQDTAPSTRISGSRTAQLKLRHFSWIQILS